MNAVAAEDFRGQFIALGRAVRSWAIREPARYGLLFGSPVPGYDAPGEQTTGPGTPRRDPADRDHRRPPIARVH